MATAKAAAPTPISLRPSTFAAGGGLIDDIDVTISKARFRMTDYDGKADQEVCVLDVTLTDGDGTDTSQMYSCGNGFVPAETGDEATTGTFLTPIGDKTAPSGSSNMALFMNSLINAGFPEDALDSGLITELEGTKVHVNRVPAPKRNNLPKRTGANADREQTILLVTTLIHLPGEAPKAAKKGATPITQGKAGAAGAKATPAAKSVGPEVDADLVDELTGKLIEAFSVAGVEEMTKVKVVPALFKVIDKTDPNRAALMAAAGKEEYLMAVDGFSWDGTTLKMG